MYPLIYRRKEVQFLSPPRRDWSVGSFAGQSGSRAKWQRGAAQTRAAIVASDGQAPPPKDADESHTYIVRKPLSRPAQGRKSEIGPPSRRFPDRCFEYYRPRTFLATCSCGRKATVLRRPRGVPPARTRLFRDDSPPSPMWVRHPLTTRPLHARHSVSRP
jgi:hypothetical protein